jgi:hypothetical protein
VDSKLPLTISRPVVFKRLQQKARYVYLLANLIYANKLPKHMSVVIFAHVRRNGLSQIVAKYGLIHNIFVIEVVPPKLVTGRH